MLLIAVGKLGRGPEQTLFDRYAARLRPALAVREVAEAPGSPAEVKRREAAALLAAVPAAAHAVVLDQGGETLDSAGLARRLEVWRGGQRKLVFVIGGAEGLDRPVLSRADMVLSLGVMTWPHQLIRVMLIEQIYRAQSILSGHPYHRAGRPDA